MRRAVAFLAALGVLIGFRVSSVLPDDEISLNVLPQGISAWTIGGERVFVVREGSVLISAFLAEAPDSGAPLRWCPVSDVFLDVESPALWNDEGRFVSGDASRDLTSVPVELDEDFILHVDPAAAEPASGRDPATVEGVVKARFDAWRAGQLALGTDFCRDPVT